MKTTLELWIESHGFETHSFEDCIWIMFPFDGEVVSVRNFKEARIALGY